MPVALVGREPERHELHQVLGLARNRRGGALRLVGDPGVGVSALLDDAAAAARGFEVLRVDGFGSETAVPFGAVQRIVRALGRGIGDPVGDVTEGEPFAVGLALLHQLARAGERRPVALLVDDVDLLDPDSLDVLGFVARRLGAERVAVLTAGRAGGDVDDRLAGTRTVEVRGLGATDATTLLNRTLQAPIEPAIAARLVTALEGNPTALCEIGRDVRPDLLTELVLGEAPLPLGRTLEKQYAAELRRLGDDAQQWLLVAAAEPTGTEHLVTAASRRLGVAVPAAEESEAAGLVVRGTSIRFRRALVRSAAYRTADDSSRRSAHEALAASADEAGLDDRADWHRSHAARGHDEALATRLEVLTQHRPRGSRASRAHALMRAAELSATPQGRARRTVLAAEEALHSGATHLSAQLADRTDETKLDRGSRAQLRVLRAEQLALTGGPQDVARAGAEMLTAARLLRGHDRAREHRALLRTWDLATFSAHLTVGLDRERLADRLEVAAVGQGEEAARVSRALSALLTEPLAAALPAIRAGIAAFLAMTPAGRLQHGRAAVSLATAAGDDGALHDVLAALTASAQEHGTHRQLEDALWLAAGVELTVGSAVRAEQHMTRIRELRRATGYDGDHLVNVALGAWAEPSSHALALAEVSRRLGHGSDHTLAVATWARAKVADGRHEEAFRRLAGLVAHPLLLPGPAWWPDLVEAAQRSGRGDVALRATVDLDERALACDTPWLRGIAARCRALVTTGPASEQHFRASTELLAGRAPLDLGRSHLVHGEWLRRRRRRRDAERELLLAREHLDAAGAVRFVARADRELAALGRTTTAAAPDGAIEKLTAQERSVAELVASGLTNAEVAGLLFLSPNTVDYHLRKVFQKLGISSRRQLRDRAGRRADVRASAPSAGGAAGRR